jgi:hypothetical protein
MEPNARPDKGNEFAGAAVMLLRAAIHRINENKERLDGWLEKPKPEDDMRRYRHINLSRLQTGGY